jgi:Predicted membrane protein
MKSFNRDMFINTGFYGGLVIKAINALIEIIGGFFVMFLTRDWLNNVIMQIALPELREDPDDPVMNYLITLSQTFSTNAQHSIAVYMLLHGITKLGIIWLLWKQKLWAFPLGMFIFGIFITYEIYSYFHNHSLLILLIVIFDIAIFIIIFMEYKRLKKKKYSIVQQ